MVFLFLFSYVILCDFFPLYDFQTDVCAPATDPEKSKDSNADDHNGQSLARDGHNTTRAVPYGLQRHDQLSNAEYMLAVWIFTLLCEEVRQVT